MFLSARPVRAATDGRWGEKRLLKVSIRATRAGRDPLRCPSIASLISVSIRATRAGRDGWPGAVGEVFSTFLSARPVRAATPKRALTLLEILVSIRATRAGRDLGAILGGWLRHVSIRATRAGRDPTVGPVCCRVTCFYPRDPCGPRRED